MKRIPVSISEVRAERADLLMRKREEIERYRVRDEDDSDGKGLQALSPKYLPDFV